MTVFSDDLGRQLSVPVPPQRIISLVPSQTELLFHLGLDAEVVGITKFCIHPQHWHQTKNRVGGTKKLDLEKIKALQPDLIIANKEENVQEQIQALSENYPVWVSDVNNLPDAIRMIHTIGSITGREAKAADIITHIQKGFETFLKPSGAPGVVYLIWQEPYMAAGGYTFIHDMLNLAGYTNLLADAQRYPVLTEEDLISMQPQYLFLSSEPYPFTEKHIKAFADILPHSKIVLVDGEMFSWYGSRLQNAPAYFTQLQQQLSSL